MRERNGRTAVLPKVTSALALGPRVDLETRVSLAEWNGQTDPLDAKFATRLHVQAPAPFVDDFEGRFWRLPDGQTGRLLRLGFYQRLAAARRAGPITIRSKATAETLSAPAAAGGNGHQRLAFETEVGGLLSGLGGSRTAVRLKVTRNSGADLERTHSLGYDRSWLLAGATELALNVGLRRTTHATVGAVEPSFGISWRGEF